MDAIIKLATSKIIPLGYKPEDYFVVSENVAIKIAKMIVKEIDLIKSNQANFKKSAAKTRSSIDRFLSLFKS